MPPFQVDDVKFLSSDGMEFVAVLIAMAISFAVMVALGYWWQR
jgi:hypothetical protein